MHKFKIGDRVEMTDEAIRQRFHISSRGKFAGQDVRTGTVTRKARDPELIHVTVDGRKHGTLYSIKFWRKFNT